jgi:hypothetical protein
MSLANNSAQLVTVVARASLGALRQPEPPCADINNHQPFEPRSRKGRTEAPLADPAGEIRRLQRENEYLSRQREILSLNRSTCFLSVAPTKSLFAHLDV